MHNLCRTQEQRWSFQQAIVTCFRGVVDRESIWLIMAANGMSRYLLRLTKVYYASTMMMVRAGGDE